MSTLQVYKPVGYIPLIGADPLADTTGGLLAYDQLVVTGIQSPLVLFNRLPLFMSCIKSLNYNTITDRAC
jgi:hypothetical protein